MTLYEEALVRIGQLEDVLYAWLLKAGGDEDLFHYDHYDAAYKALGLPGRTQELKARYQSSDEADAT